MFEPADSLKKIFAEPPSAYRHLSIIHNFLPGYSFSFQLDNGTNENMTSDTRQALRQRLSGIRDRGFGGVVANVMGPGYLENEEAWSVFLMGVDEAIKLGMRVWIYDEEGYPSGAAGGIVLRDHPEYEAQGLTRLAAEFDAGPIELRPPQGWLNVVRAEAICEGQAAPLDVASHVAADGWLRFEAPAKCLVQRFDARRAFEGTHATQNVFAIRRYVNLLQRDAVDYFFKVTAEEYIRRLGDDLRNIEAVFTDEPSFMCNYFPELPESIKNVRVQDEPERPFDRLPMIVWEATLPEKFAKRWGYDLVPEINRMFEGASPRDLRVRHDFGQLVSEIYCDAFFASQQAKLEPLGIQFSGHVLAEEDLPHHASAQGNVIADLKEMGIPGIDSLNAVAEEILDGLQLMTCKYGSSAAHAARRTQVMSESSDWVQQCLANGTNTLQRQGAVAVQMALGVTTITSYFNWKDTDPAEHRAVMDYWARLATVLRNSTHVAGVAVLYPIRTSWAYYKPMDCVLDGNLLDEPLRSLDANLHRIARRVLRTGMDFDFVDTRDLINADVSGGKIRVGDESYPILVIPPGALMCPKDIERTEQFVANGGFLLAFEPCSDFALPEIASPPDGHDVSEGKSPAQLIEQLAARWPGRVKRQTLDSDWPSIIKNAVKDDVRVELGGDYLIARQSVNDGKRFVLLANGSKDAASATVEFPAGRMIEKWDPATGEASSLGSNTAEMEIEGYGSVILMG
jgi:hypothetical protein